MICTLLAFFSYIAKIMAGNQERTFIMVKPDGVQRGLVGEIIKRFEAKGFKLVALKFVWVSFPFCWFIRKYVYHFLNSFMIWEERKSATWHFISIIFKPIQLFNSFWMKYSFFVECKIRICNGKNFVAHFVHETKR